MHKISLFVRRGLLCAALFFGPLFAGSATAESPTPPPFYAIENVTVMVGDGTVLENATVLIADGLIEAVGTGIDIPGDAWTIDGSDMKLYPGLIDAMTSLGQKSDEQGGSGGRGSGGQGEDAPQIRGPEDRPLTYPQRSAAKRLAIDEAAFSKWREAGFTAIVSTPPDGLFAGQASVIALGDGEAHEVIVADSVAQHVDFNARGARGVYPGSLMGRLSYIHQVFSDARHYDEAEKLYDADPTGLRRPAFDRTLAPIRDAVNQDLPFLLPAVVGREIDRALHMARENDLRPLIYGAHGAYDRLEALAGTSVLVSLDWPEEAKDRDPDADTALRTLYHRRMAPKVPALLAEEGISFAFYSDGLSGTGPVFEKVRKAIEEGLSEDDALRALTLAPARIYGIDGSLGTIEKGKIANLVLASDAPWAEGVEVAAVFVDGKRYAERKDEEPTEEPASDVSGTWELVLESPRGTSDIKAELAMKPDGKVSGILITDRGERTVEKGRMSGDTLSFKTTQTMGPRTMEASYTLNIEGEKIEGTLSAGPMVMDLQGERTAKPEEGEGGEDSDEKDAEEAPAVSLEELREAVAVYQGTAAEHDLFAITNAKVYTVSGETIENGTVVVEDGKIIAVGADVTVPKKAVTFDAEGGSLIPGIIDAHSHIAVNGGVNEGTLAVTSMVGIEDVLNPDDVAIYRALAGGVTSINVLHGSANPIGGQNAVLKLRWGRDADGMLFEGAPSGIKFALGENPKRDRSRFTGTPRYPLTRMGVMDVIRQAFLEAREYQKQWADYEAAAKAGRKSMPPRRDLKLEPLVEILEGKRLVHSHCYRAEEILQLLRLAEEFGFRIATLQHVLEGYKVADEIAAHGAGASTFSDWWGYKVEAYDAIPHNSALMAERGVLVSINSDSGEEMRHLNQEAAKAVKWGGMEPLEALKLVTLNPAIQLGIDDRVGSIEVGKDADLVLYDGDPLSMYSVVQKTFVDGDLYFDIELDRERQAKVDTIKEKMKPADKDADAENDDSENTAEGETEGEGSKNDPSWTSSHYSCQEHG